MILAPASIDGLSVSDDRPVDLPIPKGTTGGGGINSNYARTLGLLPVASPIIGTAPVIAISGASAEDSASNAEDLEAPDAIGSLPNRTLNIFADPITQPVSTPVITSAMDNSLEAIVAPLTAAQSVGTTATVAAATAPKPPSDKLLMWAVIIAILFWFYR